MIPPDTFKSKEILRAAILRDMRDAQNLDMFEIESAFHQAMKSTFLIYLRLAKLRRLSGQ
jgi:hypothetical protein